MAPIPFQPHLGISTTHALQLVRLPTAPAQVGSGAEEEMFSTTPCAFVTARLDDASHPTRPTRRTEYLSAVRSTICLRTGLLYPAQQHDILDRLIDLAPPTAAQTLFCGPDDHGFGGKLYCKVFMIRSRGLVLVWKQALVLHCLEGGWRSEVFGFPHAHSLPSRRFEVLQRPFSCSPGTASAYSQLHPFCVDENPRLTACTRTAYQHCEPTLRESYSILLSVFHSGSRERIYHHPHRVLSYRHVLNSWHRATRLSLDTRSHNRRSSFYPSSATIVRAHTPIPIAVKVHFYSAARYIGDFGLPAEKIRVLTRSALKR
ncbi:hypothetical protein C8J57DRAFT_1528340 [Mycena rebaudengoi]|nr:hypothetical protein C8J57DRAFT_1528340 [Mycena rebaudengoi]